MQKKTIIITGSSSGLGKALAVEYASHDTRLFLFARSEERLKNVADLCKNRAAETYTISCDVTDKESMQKHINDIAVKHGIDLIIACAGVSAGTLDGFETTSQVNKIFATNLDGVLNTIMPAIPAMIQKQSGNIIIISSMASMIGLASSPSYSASKAAVSSFGSSLRAYLKQYNINVSVVIPGYIETPMTAVNNFPMPFMIKPEKAARKIAVNAKKNKGIIAFPLIMYIFLKLISILPNGLVCYINSKLPGKPAFDEDK